MEGAQSSTALVVVGRPFPPGVSGNPGGRPKERRSASVALRDLRATPGETIPEVVENYRAARRADGGVLAVDLTAIGLFVREMNPSPKNGLQVSAFCAVTDRLEGKVSQVVTNINATLTAAELVAMTDEQLEALARPR